MTASRIDPATFRPVVQYLNPTFVAALWVIQRMADKEW